MKLGLYLPTVNSRVPATDVVRFAREAEAMDFHSVWTFEHLFTPVTLRSKYPYTSDGSYGIDPEHSLVDPLGQLGVLAGATSKITLGTAALIPTYRHPIPLGKALTAIEVMAGPRLLLGLGTGWMEEEFEAVGIDARRRGARLEEHVRAMRHVWSGGPDAFEGEFYRWEPAWFVPRPPRGDGGIPILFAGHADAVLRRVARMGGGWAISSMLAGGGTMQERLRRVGFDYYRDGLDRLRSACDAVGRDFDELSNLVSRPIVLGDRFDGEAADRPVLVGDVDQVLTDLAELAKLGVSIVNLTVFGRTVDEVLPALERIAIDVLPAARDL